MNIKTFTTKKDDNNQWFVYRQPMDQPIGFFDDYGNFYFDTDGSQVEVHIEDMKELAELLFSKQKELTA